MIKLGLDAKAYRNSGTYAAPAWSEMTDAQEVTLNLEGAEAEVPRRGSVWRKRLLGLLDGSVEFQVLYDGADGDFQAIRDAFLGREVIDLAFADGDIATAGTQYLRSEWYVTSFTRNEPLEEALTYSVTVRPAESENDPEWVTV
jgi:hypothetical protein